MVVKQFFRGKLVDWIQAICSVLLVVAAFTALYSWRSQKEYEVRVLAMANAATDLETFINIHARDDFFLGDVEKDSIVSWAQNHKQLLSDFPNIADVLLRRQIYVNSKDHYREEYRVMIDHSNLVISTFKNKNLNNDPIVCFYALLKENDKARSLDFQLFHLIVHKLTTFSSLSKVERDEEYRDLQSVINSILKNENKLRADIMSLKDCLDKISL